MSVVYSLYLIVVAEPLKGNDIKEHIANRGKHWQYSHVVYPLSVLNNTIVDVFDSESNIFFFGVSAQETAFYSIDNEEIVEHILNIATTYAVPINVIESFVVARHRLFEKQNPITGKLPTKNSLRKPYTSRVEMIGPTYWLIITANEPYEEILTYDNNAECPIIYRGGMPNGYWWTFNKARALRYSIDKITNKQYPFLTGKLCGGKVLHLYTNTFAHTMEYLLRRYGIDTIIAMLEQHGIRVATVDNDDDFGDVMDTCIYRKSSKTGPIYDIVIDILTGDYEMFAKRVWNTTDKIVANMFRSTYDLII